MADFSEGLAWLMVAGVMFALMGALLLLLAVRNARHERAVIRASHRRAAAAGARADAQKDRATAAVLRAQRALDRQAGRRTRRRDGPWSSAGMNALLLLMLMAPYADRLTLGM